jgi:hypothetical protein
MFERSFWAAIGIGLLVLVGIVILFSGDCSGGGGSSYGRTGSYRTGSSGSGSYGGYGK